MSDCRALLWLMNYKGNNHAVKRLQLEMLGYWFTIVNRPGRMLEDANYFSRLAEDIIIDPILKDYLAFARQSYSKYPPKQRELTVHNMPGCRPSKRRKTDESAKIEKNEHEDVTVSNFASLKFLNQDCTIHDDTEPPIWQSISNIPVSFTSCMNHNHRKNYGSYVAEFALLHRFYWCIFNPHLGHWLDCSQNNTLPFECVFAISPDQTSRDAMQQLEVPIIKDNIEDASQFVSTSDHPITINSYYATVHHNCSSKIKERNELLDHSQFIKLLTQKAKLQIAMIEVYGPFQSKYIEAFCNNLRLISWKTYLQHINFEEHSDKIDNNLLLITCLNKRYYNQVSSTDVTVIKSPTLPIDLNPQIETGFNTESYSVPYVDKLFEVKAHGRPDIRKPFKKVSLKLKTNTSETISPGYDIYSTNHPAPLPLLNPGGLFSSLFGIFYQDLNTRLYLCRTISIYEYLSFFLFSKNYTVKSAGTSQILKTLQTTTAFRTLSDILHKAYKLLIQFQESSVTYNAISTWLDLDVPSFMNGIIMNELPNEYAWTSGYKRDPSCAMLIKMVQQPSLITKANLDQVNYIYRDPMRKHQIEYKNNRLIYNEPIAASHKALKLIIVPLSLRHHIFVSFHANPIGGHFKLYQTLHCIRLRYHWPKMFSYIRDAIDNCAACILKDNVRRSLSELLYWFPLNAPWLTIHADLWSPGKITGYTDTTALMIVMDHMTGFVAIEPLTKLLNSRTFAQAIFRIAIRYGLPHMIITDPDSKFKKEFEEMCQLLKWQHHLSTKGNHNAILVERFNRFLNSSVKVFNSDHGTNRVFLEDAEMMTYAWNSAPVHGTDLSHSLLNVGREFHFPIDFTSRHHITFDVDTPEVKSFAYELTALLQKSREIYKLLIHEHRCAHREFRNSQLNNPRKFKLDDIVFTNVQVQSKNQSGQVGKLSYINRGPYKIVKVHPNGSYDLELLKTGNIIKKHGSELYLSPQLIKPLEPLNSSDKIYGDINKKTIDDPFNIVRIKNYSPVQPWKNTAPAASSQLHPIPKANIESFPTVSQLDDEFDSWPESHNPFAPAIEVTSMDIKDSSINGTDHTIIKETPPHSCFPTNTTFAQLLAHILSSDDKLFFIKYILPNQARSEWKLVRIDLETSLSKRPSCLQDGRFLIDFYIAHPNDKKLPPEDTRYWLEYHERINTKTIGVDYHIIQPSELLTEQALNKGLVTYREWFDFSNISNILHGPFNFASRNNKKTRDRISTLDWNLLQSQHTSYDNSPPVLSSSTATILHLNEPIFYSGQHEHVSNRVNLFLSSLHLDDMQLTDLH